MSAAAAPPVAPSRDTGSTARTVALVLLSLSFMLAYFDRLLMVVIGQTVKGEFGLSDTELSLLTGASFVIVYGTFGIVGGWLVDRYSRKVILGWSLVAWSCLTMACGLAGSFIQLAIARAGVGIGEASIVPVGNSAISDLYPPAKRPLALSIFYVGGMAGILGTFIIGTWVAQTYGWRTAFLVAGPPGILLAIAVAFLFKEPVREKRATTDEAAHEVGASPFKLFIRNKPLPWLVAAGAISSYGNIGIVQTWLPIYFIRSHELTPFEVGQFFGPVLAGGMTVGMLSGGWIGNKIAAKSALELIRYCTLFVFAMIPLYLAALLLDSLAAALVLTFIATAVSVVYSPSFTSATQTITHPRARGTVAGISSFLNAVLGGAVCAFIVGVLSDLWAPRFGADSLRYALLASMTFIVAGALLFMQAHRLAKRAGEGADG